MKKNYWSGFSAFIRSVRARGGIWAGNDVYFSQLRDGYTAAYKPDYPKNSKKDETIFSAGLSAR